MALSVAGGGGGHGAVLWAQVAGLLSAAMVAQPGITGLVPRVEGTIRGSIASQKASNYKEATQALAEAIGGAANIAPDAQGIAVAATTTLQGNASFEGFVWNLIAQIGVQAATSAIAQLANAACPKRNQAKEAEAPTTPQEKPQDTPNHMGEDDTNHLGYSNGLASISPIPHEKEPRP